MIRCFGLVILTQKEVLQLAKEERDLGYRAGLKSKWRARKKESAIIVPMEDNRPTADGEPTFVDDLLTLSRTGALPTVYGDSLPIKEPDEGIAGC
jgi:hypothetical protein